MQTLDDTSVLIPDVFDGHARALPDKDAVVCGAVRRNWRDFNANINRVANALGAAGIGPGQQVAVLMGNAVEMLEVVFGIVKAGAAWCRCRACSRVNNWPRWCMTVTA